METPIWVFSCSGFCSEKVETIVTPSHGKVGAMGLGISSNVISVQTNVVKTMPCLPPMTGNGL